LSKINEASWKSKAIERNVEIRILKRQLLEVRKSRDNWKEKCRQQQKTKAELVKHKPKGHQYPSALIWLCIYVYNQSQCSLRSCCTMIAGCSILLEINCKRPCASSIRNWIIKSGYYIYHQPPAAGNWCVIIDESVSIGHEKLLLVLGIPLSCWEFSKAIVHKDVSVLYVGIATSWNSKKIASVLNDLEQKITISYCVSDRGNNIKSAIRKQGYLNIFDCSHEWAKCLEKCYKKDADFLLMTQQMGLIRRKWATSKHAHLMPPALRTKARFQNIFPLIEWIENIKSHWDFIDESAKEELSFINDNKAMIDDLVTLNTVIDKIAIILKISGLNKSNIEQCKRLLNEYCTTKTTLYISKLMQDNWLRYESVFEETETTFICSSDIIESYFGKFKEKIKLNGMQAITESVLAISMWTQDITTTKIDTALESVKMKDIYEWKENNTTHSLHKKRTTFFAQNCKKQAA